MREIPQNCVKIRSVQHVRKKEECPIFLPSACTYCHADSETGTLIAPEPGLCVGCHADRVGRGEHRIEIPVKAPLAQPLPLKVKVSDFSLKPVLVITCITCHDVHATQRPLPRLPSDELCQACHQKH